MVQAEPWLERDKAMIDPLKTIGIEQGKPFAPDAKTQQILEAARSGRRKPGSRPGYDTLPPFYEGEHWFFPSTEELSADVDGRFCETPDSYPVDARGTAYYCAFFSVKHLGQASSI